MKIIKADDIKKEAFVIYTHFDAGTMPWHTHHRAQLAYVSEGSFTVRTEQGIWIAPTYRAVWILPGVRHTTYSSRPYQLCSLLFEPDLIELPSKCGVVAIDPLLHELLLAAALFGPNYKPGSAEERLIRVIFDHLPKLPVLPLYLPQPKDDRLQIITRQLIKEPSNTQPLSILAGAAGLTERTAERLFHKETGMTFGKWRQQLRLVTALQKLSHGKSVTEVALDVGYNDVSAFIAMFKNTLGVTPAQYFKQNDKFAKSMRFSFPESPLFLTHNNITKPTPVFRKRRIHKRDSSTI